MFWYLYSSFRCPLLYVCVRVCLPMNPNSNEYTHIVMDNETNDKHKSQNTQHYHIQMFNSTFTHACLSNRAVCLFMFRFMSILDPFKYTYISDCKCYTNLTIFKFVLIKFIFVYQFDALVKKLCWISKSLFLYWTYLNPYADLYMTIDKKRMYYPWYIFILRVEHKCTMDSILSLCQWE